jgi:proline dehydrogenase
MLRRVLLSLSRSNSAARLLARSGWAARMARRFVAGETLAEAIAAVRELNARGILASLDYLGEGAATVEQARTASREYLQILEAIDRAGVSCDVSVKLTQFGLDIDANLAEATMRTIAADARRLGNFVRIDMESSRYTSITLDLYRRLHAEFDGSLGTVLQSYLRRTASDVCELLPLNPDIRLCKGAYNEPPEIAFPSKDDVDRNYLEQMEVLLRGGGYTAIATHDPAILRKATALVRRLGIENSQFEFEMLYGIRRDLQAELAAEGYTVRVYVPFGTQWYPYFMRRLAERPANLWFVLRNLIR